MPYYNEFNSFLSYLPKSNHTREVLRCCVLCRASKSGVLFSPFAYCQLLFKSISGLYCPCNRNVTIFQPPSPIFSIFLVQPCMARCIRLEGASYPYGARCCPVYISLARFVIPTPYISADFDMIEVDMKVVWLSFVGRELTV